MMNTPHDPATDDASLERAGDVMGPYRLVEPIGEGGFGVVWLAEQSQPVQRRVALKIIKAGMDTRQVIARFEAERQALAMMDHPGIATVLGAGSTETGRPFFAMEYIEGMSILDHCRTRNLDTAARLDLFVQVCHAIQHAHQKGIIHRDIKPSNVLVTVHDGVATPRVIDFGVATAIGEPRTARTAFTQGRQLVGTPAYMSPEQAAASGRDVDTRSDIYALGVLLYEMITGSPPFTAAELAEAGFEGMMRMIREVEPPKPSTRLLAFGGPGTPVSPRVPGAGRSLAARLRGDLDWIVMKCLEKDRTRRYDTAGGVADDIRRYLEYEPVVARPPSTGYRLRKFVRRHRGRVVAGSLITTTLVLGILGTRVAMAWAGRERAEAESAEAAADARAAEFERIVSFQSRQLQSVVPEAMGAAIRRRMVDAIPDERRAVLEPALARLNFTSLALDTLSDGILEVMVAAIDAQFLEQPLIRAQLLQSIAIAAREIGLFELASDPQTRAFTLHRAELGEADPATLRSRGHAGSLLISQGRFDEAEPHLRAALTGFEALHGEDHPDTLTAITNVGFLLKEQGRLTESEPYFRRALAGRRRVLGDGHPDTLDALNNIGSLLVAQGRFDEAEPYDLEVLAGFRRLLGDDHPDTLGVINNMGYRLQQLGRFDEAEPWFREALDGFRRVLGDDHQLTLIGMDNLGYLLNELGALEEAEELHREALAGYRRVLGDDHPGTLNSLNLMGALLLRQGRLVEAEPYFIEAMDGSRRVLGDRHPATLSAINSFGVALQSQGWFERAEPYFREAFEGYRAVNGEGHPETLVALSNLSLMLASLGRGEEALQMADDAIAGGQSAFGPGSFAIGNFLGKRGRALQTLERYEDAARAMTESHEILTATLGEAHEQTQRVIGYLAELHDVRHAAEPGAGYDAEASAWRARLRP